MKHLKRCARCLYFIALILFAIPSMAEQMAGSADMNGAPLIGMDHKYILSMNDEEYQWVAFTADSDQAYYRVDYKNEEMNTALYMELYDANGIRLDKTDAYKGKAGYISFKAEPGARYYLGFSRYSEDYPGRLTLQLSKHPDAYADNLNQAGEIQIGESIISSFDGTGDEDFLYLTSGADSAFCRVDFKNENTNTSVYVELLDKDGFSLLKESVSKGQASYISFKAEPLQKYYLRLYRYSKDTDGRYTLSVSSTPDAEPDQMESAIQAEAGNQMLGSFDGTGDTDWFKMKASPVNAYYQVDFRNESTGTTVYAEVFDHHGLSVAREGASKGYTAWINWMANPGEEYFIKFDRYSKSENGEYSFVLREFPDMIPNELAQSADLLSETEGEYTLGSKNDADWFAVRAGDLPVFTDLTLHSADTAMRLTLTDANEQKIDTLYVSGGKTDTISFAMEPGACVYAKVTGDTSGAYSLSRRDTCDVGGSGPQSAFAAAAGESAVITLEMREDTDYVALPGASASVLVTNPQSSSIRVCVVDSNGQTIADERSLYEGKSYAYTADREDAYLRVRGNGRFSVSCCTPDMHIVSGQWVQVCESSCAQEGVRQMLCLVCGEAARQETDPVLEHQTGAEWETQRSAGCDDEGLEARHCVLCGEVMETRVIPAAGHLHTGWDILVNPSCEAEGLQQRMCRDCGKMLEQEIIPAHGHVAGEWGVYQEATCMQPGMKARSCQVCRKVVEQQPVAAAGHSVSDWAVAVSASCEGEGRKIRYCHQCGETVAQEAMPALGHDHGEWVVTREPAMSEEGEQTRTCTRCGDTQTQQIAKRGLFDGLIGK